MEPRKTSLNKKGRIRRWSEGEEKKDSKERDFYFKGLQF